jgi:hypothetical protein
MLSQLSHGEGLLEPTKEDIGIAVFLVAVYLALNVVSAVLEVLKASRSDHRPGSNSSGTSMGAFGFRLPCP